VERSLSSLRSDAVSASSPFPPGPDTSRADLVITQLDGCTLAQAVSDSLATLHGSPAALRMELDSSTLATITNLTIEGDNEQRATRHEYHQRG
jgi:hypothetical protein